MDIEWARDGLDGQLYILQARPETVRSRESSGRVTALQAHRHGDRRWSRAAPSGSGSAPAPVQVLASVEDMHTFTPGEVLVADMTDPDWEPIMKRASAIVTNRGGRTCHAAIIARELGIPAIVGTGTATRDLADGPAVTVSCAEGDTGFVYDGILDFVVEETELDTMPDVPVKIMMNVGTPDQAFAFSQIPNAGIGLARLEFIINRQIGIHPRALLDFDTLAEPLRGQVAAATAAYPSPRDYFVTRVAEGVAMLAAAFAPEPVIVRMSDFKSNEYANLVGGELYEPDEENPMIGFRGASRYLSADFADCFAMECEALRFVRDEMGLTNVKIMIPFVRTVAEASGVIDLLASHGLRRGENDLQVVMMCEVPSNALLADAVPRPLRRLLDRLERPHPADPGAGPGLGADRRRLRRARPGRQGADQPGHPGLPGARASTSASAARGPATTPTSPTGCSTKGSSRCHSTRTPWSTPGPGSAGIDVRRLVERGLPHWRELREPSRRRERSRPGPSRRLLIMGPPGAGKGTQAAAVAARLRRARHLDRGHVPRACSTRTPRWRCGSARIMAAGGYVDDETTNAIVADRLDRADCRGGFLLDGYPRTLGQVGTLDVLLTGAGTTSSTP